MSTQNLTNDDFEKTVADNPIVLVDFWAPWCGPCRQFGPVFEAASDKTDDVVFAKVNTDEQQALAQAVQISSIPTIMAFREGLPVFRQAGALPAAALDDLISQIRNLNMDEVRAQLASQQDDSSTLS